MAEVIVLDTSAFLTLMEQEAGADEVEGHIAGAIEGTTHLHASFVSLTEIEYITAQENDQATADSRIADITALPIVWHHSDAALCSAAAKLKVAHKLSFADTFVVALAQHLDARLVHKDPEMADLGGEVKQHMLPPKK